MKRIGLLLLAVSMAASLVGCAYVKVTEPADRSFDRSRIYQIPFEKVWARVVDWFADHNVTIEKIEKESGLITARYYLKVDDEFLECGKIEVGGTEAPPLIQRYGALNVTVRSVSDNETKVNVNFFGEFELDARDGWDGRPVAFKGRCVSTGNLEKGILDSIAR